MSDVLILTGRVCAALGDNVDTDLIYPGRYLNITDRAQTPEHLFELAYPEIRKEMAPGAFLVAGRNFGCGSSREQAAAALRFSGCRAVIAVSFARIFYRNAINLGLPAIVCPGAADRCSPGDDLAIDILAGEIRNLTRGETLRAAPLDARAAELLAAGGLIPYLKHRHRSAPCVTTG